MDGVTVRVVYSPETMVTRIFATRVVNGQAQTYSEYNGWQDIPPGVETLDCLATIPDWLLDDVKQALGHISDAALAEALRHERRRVDAVLERTLDIMAGGARA